MDTMQKVRLEAAIIANADDASVWRWFSYLLEERRIRWRFQFGNWHVSVDRVHVARAATFDRAIREAKATAEERRLAEKRKQPGEAAIP
ncbi:hypothetical protein [Burkholderia cenocepacia]|uniref:hypothetical protein n=1 Tax=Burkholderia cepacia complex TaxID=87882 RepID=UPI002AB6CE7E|nr:hypothetical protein [Burkholderia cenocepacia]